MGLIGQGRKEKPSAFAEGYPQKRPRGSVVTCADRAGGH